MAAPVQVDADKQSAIQAGGTSIVVTKPTNLADDDVLYACLARDNSSASDAVTAPSGWTKLGGSEVDNNTFTAGIYRKVIVTASGEPTNYTWSWGSSEKAVAWIIRVTGADTTTPEDVTPSNNTGTSTAPRALAVTTITADTLLLAIGGVSDKVANNWTAPSGMTEFFDVVSTGGGGAAAHASCGAAEVNQAGTGTTGDKDFAVLASKDWVAFLIAVRPTTGGGGDRNITATLVDVTLADVDTSLNMTRDVVVTVVDVAVVDIDASLNMTRAVLSTVVDVTVADRDAALNMTRDVVATLIDVAVADRDASLDTPRNLAATLVDVSVADLDSVIETDRDIVATLIDVSVADIDATVELTAARNISATLIDVSVADIDAVVGAERDITATLIDVTVVDIDSTVGRAREIIATLIDVSVAAFTATVSGSPGAAIVSFVRRVRLFTFIGRR